MRPELVNNRQGDPKTLSSIFCSVRRMGVITLPPDGGKDRMISAEQLVGISSSKCYIENGDENVQRQAYVDRYISKMIANA